jgi:hypothetical protein
MKFAKGIAGVLALAVVGAGCARLDPRVSEEYKSVAKATHQVLTDQDYLQELQKQWGTDGMELDTQMVRATTESKRALNTSARARKTWGDDRLHKQLWSYAGALADEEIAIFVAGEGLRKPWKPELAAKLAELESKKREARQKVEAGLR